MPKLTCYQCEKLVSYLLEDGRCSACTRLTPDEVIGHIENESSIAHLISLFETQHIDARVDEYNCLIIDIDPIHIWITARPHYCDRGRWQVNAETTDPRRMCIDAADGFPRYYFTDIALIIECQAFIKKRIGNLRDKEA